MRSHVLEEVIAAIETLQIDEVTKARCLNAVCAVGRRNGIKAITVRERLSFAAGLLANGASRSEVQKRLVCAHKISARHANRIIENARQIGHL